MRQDIRCRSPLALVLKLIVILAASTYTPTALAEDRTIDGFGNNALQPDWGEAKSRFVRVAPADYADGASRPRIAGRPNPRLVGLSFFRQAESRPNARNLSGFVYAFGQFLSHDLQRTTSGAGESIAFAIPPEDDQFFPGQTVPLNRSIFDPATGTSPNNPRQQVNFATSFLDGSQVYGSDETTASILRGGPAHPRAKLRTSDDINGDGQNMLPRNAFGPSPEAPFVAGDDRVNDNIVLTCFQTLFMREHNRLVDELSTQHGEWTEERLYQRARKIVGAELQSITFKEFLPALLGPYAPSAEGSYDPSVDPTIINEVPVVFLRTGHSMLPERFLRVQNDGQPAAGGSVSVIDAFFNQALLTTSQEMDLLLKGLSVERQEETDLQFADSMRLGLLDAFDVQRARDHGIANYNDLREAYGLARAKDFSQISTDPTVLLALESFYQDVDEVDPLVGVLAEDHLPGASVGPLAAAALRLQFERLRDGDRFWYRNDSEFSPEEVRRLDQTSLSAVILRNAGVRNLRGNVFFIPESSSRALASIVVLGWVLLKVRRT